MLEEAIRNYEKVHPAEIALAMLSFIQSELPAGGPAAETRFLNLFLPLCECIFGPMNPPDRVYRHKEGGWLSVQNQWPRVTPSTVATSSSTHPMTSSSHIRQPLKSNAHLSTSVTAFNDSLDSDPVVKLLGTAGKPPSISEPLPMTLIEAISKESENRPSVTFPLKFHSLPLPLQDSWLALIKEESTMRTGNRVLSSLTTLKASICSENDVCLLGRLLRKGPDEQNELQLFHQRKAIQTNNNTQPDYLGQQSKQQHQQYLSPINIRSNSNVASVSVSSVQGPTFGVMSSLKSVTDNMLDLQDGSPDVMLSMLEYFLFVFLRFPLALPERGRAAPSSSSSIPGVHVHRVATERTYGGPPNHTRIMREPFGDTLYYHFFRRYMRHFLPYETEDSCRSIAFVNDAQLRESALFLRICIAMWLESQSRLSPTEVVLRSILERRRHRTGLLYHETAKASFLDLNASYDLTQVLMKYDSVPKQIHKCLRTLIIHAILDPTLMQKNVDRQRGTSNTLNEKFCLSECMSALQQPVYNYVRSTFRFAPIHSSSESSFYGALNIWLIWLEPWNVAQCTSDRDSCLKLTHAMCWWDYSYTSRFFCSSTSCFSAPIARNTPFSAKHATERIMGSVAGKVPGTGRVTMQRALTIPRHNQASKYDSSQWEPYVAANVYMYAVPLAIFLVRARELDFSVHKFDRSLEIVQRVFRVFTPSLVDAISRHLDNSQHPVTGSCQVECHRSNLGPFAPPCGTLSLSSLKADMQSLLEEVDMQYMKKVRELDTFDWLLGKVEGLFGVGAVSREEKTLEILVDRAKVIVCLPVDFDFVTRKGHVAPTNMLERATLGKSNPPTRTKQGELTDFARKQLVLGAIRLKPDDVTFIGDHTRTYVKNHEIPLLVDLMIWASDALNRRFGISSHQHEFRVNLRFFADYRNVIFAIATAYILFKLL
jgi:hypothetical protein